MADSAIIKAALERLNAGPTTPDDALLLLSTGYNLGLTRVQGADSEASQIIRWAIEDNQDFRIWDVFKVMKPGQPDKYLTRRVGEKRDEEQLKDLTRGWMNAFAECS